MQNYDSFFRGSNEKEFPGSAFLIYLCEPVIVIRYKAKERFDSFGDFEKHVEEVKWIPELAWVKTKVVRDQTIRQAWEFLEAEQ